MQIAGPPKRDEVSGTLNYETQVTSPGAARELPGGGYSLLGLDTAKSTHLSEVLRSLCVSLTSLACGLKGLPPSTHSHIL